MNTIKGLDKLTSDWEYVKEIIPYGCGLEAHSTLKRIIQDFDVPYIIDKDEKKWSQKCYGVSIVGPDKLASIKDGQKVVITMAPRRYEEIKKVLESYGLVEYKDFCHMSQFGIEWYYRYKKEYCIIKVDLAITTACTLKCEKCNMFIPHHKNRVMYNFEEMKTSIDLLFERVDYVFIIGILGGEALLNKDLKKVIEYLYTTYPERFGCVRITTNGVMIPDEDTLNLFKKYNILVVISDYKCAIADKSKLDDLKEILEDKGIICQIRRDLIWTDFGFPNKPFKVENGNERKHMLECDPGWRGLNDGKFFFCNVAWSAEKAGLFKLKDNDYIDLKMLPAGTEESKKKLLEYSLGQLENGYMSFCKVCGGCGPDNQNFIEAGKQMQ